MSSSKDCFLIKRLSWTGPSLFYMQRRSSSSIKAIILLDVLTSPAANFCFPFYNCLNILFLLELLPSAGCKTSQHFSLLPLLITLSAWILLELFNLSFGKEMSHFCLNSKFNYVILEMCKLFFVT